MPISETDLYAAGNPHVPYSAIPEESPYTELDRENAGLKLAASLLRAQCTELRVALGAARSRAWWLGVAVGVYTVGGLVVVGILLLR